MGACATTLTMRTTVGELDHHGTQCHGCILRVSLTKVLLKEIVTNANLYAKSLCRYVARRH